MTWPSSNVGAQSSIVGMSLSEVVIAIVPVILLWNSARLEKLLLQLIQAVEDFYSFVPHPKQYGVNDCHSLLVAVLNILAVLFKIIYFSYWQIVDPAMLVHISLLGVLVLSGECICIITFRVVVRILAQYLEDAAKVFIKSWPYWGSPMLSVGHKVKLDDELYAFERHVRKVRLTLLTYYIIFTYILLFFLHII